LTSVFTVLSPPNLVIHTGADSGERASGTVGMDSPHTELWINPLEKKVNLFSL
jgi:hypothetical protein